MRVGDTVPIWYMTNTNFEDVLARALVSTRSEAMSTWTNYSLKEEKLTDDTLAAVKGNLITALGSTTLPRRVFGDSARINVST